MALEQLAFDILKSLAPCRLLSLGVPDLLLTDEYDVKRVDNEAQLQRWHSWSHPIYDTVAMFHEFGIEATYLDNQAHRGNEIVADLNEDLSRRDEIETCLGWNPPDRRIPWIQPFDVVLDPGTLEHCFNIGQAFRNVRDLCRPGGTIIHVNPLSMFNHGFWNLNPCAYADWYGDNGDEVLSSHVIGGPLDERLVYRSKPWQRFGAENSMINQVIVRRGEGPTIDGWPSQVKYSAEKKAKALAAMKAERDDRA